jgi:hypothetical protein
MNFNPCQEKYSGKEKKETPEKGNENLFKINEES